MLAIDYEPRPEKSRGRAGRVAMVELQLDEPLRWVLCERRSNGERVAHQAQYRPYCPLQIRDRPPLSPGPDAERCTFEVLLDLLERPDPALRHMADIVHELDLRDQKYQWEKTAGVKQLLGGLVANHPRDEDRLERAGQFFDDLYRAFSQARQPG